jgi:excisionase family DNA binding protein
MNDVQAEQSPPPVEVHRTVAEPLRMEDLRREGVTISVDRASGYIGVSRAYAYQMAREGRLPIIRVGAKRMRVKTAALIKMLDGQ